MVQLLVLPGADGFEDQEALQLGRELAGPSVTSHVVARLGSTKQLLERDRLALLLSRIGREGAIALSDALGEARDRSQRRAFMDAMGAMGPAGLESAQRMVEDPRWFVVRNGVALLGDLGGKDAINYLTGALANSDPRVRKEAVRSLAKVGGRDAETLVVGMLADGDPGVRAASCQALGVLKASRSVKPLVDALKDESFDVQVESLRALGQIGDPGVVRTVEKRALGGFFSKGTKEVRIAAFRALAGIGTPGALRVLEKGANDTDPTVRTVARALMDTD
jgi:HEAT repeat protein